jgi:predicted nucleic acid-binding Zn ribbon protein
MEYEIICPKCLKRNGLNKFCIYCGQKLLDDEQIRLILDNPEPYCLNCGRLVENDQKKCECGYEFSDINCPECNSKNSYTNRFCITCGKKLWTSNVFDYKYPKRLFEKHLLKEVLPYSLRNTSLYQRTKLDFTLGHLNGLESAKSKIDEYLCEIGSRWKVVSPNYCINCFNIIKPDECSCTKCDSILFADKKRVDCLQTKNKYVEPKFDNAGLKWTQKFSNYYLGSLAPAIGESQFEYRERLKWEFAENNYHKMGIISAIDRKRKDEERKKQADERRRREEEYIRQFGGGYCSSSCRYHYEEIITPNGISVDYTEDMCGVDYCCRLGHSVSYGSFCKDYE